MADIVRTQVFHARTGARRNAFHYQLFYAALPLGEISRGLKRLLFSVDRFNLVSFRTRDHGDGKTPPEAWMRSILEKWNVREADGEIVLLTLPRMLFYLFNPVSFWFCFDKGGALRAVLAEVNNTFGERHCYLCCHDDHRAIAPNDWLQTDKVFHVSPFMRVDGHYRFRFAYEDTRIALWINHYDAAGLTLSTSMIGERQPLTSARLLYYFVRYPLITLKVIALIHYQAVKLFLKGVRHHSKPLPPAAEISR